MKYRDIPAASQQNTWILINGSRSRGFLCEYKGMIRMKTFIQWEALTGIPKETIRNRFYTDRTARECIGLDKIERHTGGCKRKVMPSVPNTIRNCAANLFLYGVR